jgi:hypothetical protein
VNLFKTSPGVSELLYRAASTIGQAVMQLEGIDGVRVWHDQALYVTYLERVSRHSVWVGNAGTDTSLSSTLPQVQATFRQPHLMAHRHALLVLHIASRVLSLVGFGRRHSAEWLYALLERSVIAMISRSSSKMGA